jgi:hypothetical protein
MAARALFDSLNGAGEKLGVGAGFAAGRKLHLKYTKENQHQFRADVPTPSEFGTTSLTEG